MGNSLRNITIEGTSYELNSHNSYISNTENCYTTTGTTAGLWSVSIPGVNNLIEGLTIKIRLNIAGTNNNTSFTVVTKNDDGTETTETISAKCFLDLNRFGKLPVYARYNSFLTTHYAVESVIALTYSSKAGLTGKGNPVPGWIVENYYDSTNTYQLRKYYTRFKPKNILYRYMICFINNNNELIPVNSVNNSTATTKTLTTESFNPTRGIFYYSSTSSVATTSLTGLSTLFQQYGPIDIRYSFNTGTTLTANDPIYLVVVQQSDGQVKLASSPIVQNLPTSDNGNLYIYLGNAYSTYQIELVIEHPIFRYKNGRIEEVVFCDNTYVSYTKNNSVNVVGNTKTVSKVSPETLYVPNGLIMGGTAASAGLVTRGICGVSTPGDTGACTKENLYINYDGDNNNNPNGRGLVINAGGVGSDLGNGVYSYCAVRGDAMKAYCDNHYASNASNTNIAKTGISASFSGSSHTHTLPDYVVKTESANTGTSASSYTVLSSAKSSSSSITCSYDSTNKRLSITINSFPKEFNTVNVSSSSHTHSYTKATGTATPSKALGSTTQGGTITITDNGHVHAQK